MFEIARRVASRWPVLNPVLAAAATAGSWVRPGARARFSYDSGIGGWIHRWPGGTLVDTALRGYQPAYFEDRLREVVLPGMEVRSGDLVVEIGAGTGTETLFLSRMAGPSGRVVAVEAHPATASLLDRCVEENRLRNVTTAPVCVTAGGVDEVFLTSLEGHHSNRMSAQGGVRVPACSLDELTEAHDVGAIDLLKLNIEGAELEALRGGEATLARTRQVSVSCHDFKASQDPQFATSDGVVRLLEAAGFETTRPESDGTWRTSYVHARRR